MLSIDRMMLHVPGLPEHQARALAEHVAAGLAAATGLPDGTDMPAIRLDLPSLTSAGDVAALARQIVAATLRAIGQSSGGVP